MHVLTTAPHKLRIRSASSDHGHWRHAGRHAPGGMATPSDHGGGVLDHGRFTVGSRRNVPAARADEQCTVRIIRAPYINSRRARYDGMSRLDEDVPTGLGSRAVGSPFDRPTPATPTVWYRAANQLSIASGCRLSCLSPCTCRRNRYSPHVCGSGPRARRPGRGQPAGVGSRAPSATARCRSPAKRYRPAGPAARAVWCDCFVALRPRVRVRPAIGPDLCPITFRIFGPSATATAHTSQIDVIYTHITSWRRCTR
jgi:hypothetical protein